MQSVLEEIDDPSFRSYVIFAPMLRADNEEAARERAAQFSDERLTYFWDPDIVAGRAWQETYEFDNIAWDVYLLYDAGTIWAGAPSRGELAMTGHRGITHKLENLQVERYIAEARKLLSP